MENNVKQQDEMNVRKGVLECLTDHDRITISVHRFEELVQAEIFIGVIRKMYKTSESYSLQDYLAFIFGPPPQKEKDKKG